MKRCGTTLLTTIDEFENSWKSIFAKLQGGQGIPNVVPINALREVFCLSSCVFKYFSRPGIY